MPNILLKLEKNNFDNTKISNQIKHILQYCCVLLKRNSQNPIKFYY